MSQVLAWVVEAGRLIQSVTSITLVNNTLKTVDFTMVAGKRWILKNVKIVNPDDVQRVTDLSKYKTVAKTNKIKTMLNVTLGVGVTMNWPNSVNQANDQASRNFQPEILIEGNTVTVAWAGGGASAGGTDADGLVVEYLELDA